MLQEVKVPIFMQIKILYCSANNHNSIYYCITFSTKLYWQSLQIDTWTEHLPMTLFIVTMAAVQKFLNIHGNVPNIYRFGIKKNLETLT